MDITKYDACISQSINSRIYAYSWYLDAVADQWEVLVYGDYVAVMPIPKLKLKRHLWFPKIYMPPFVQQLGIFTDKDLDKELVNAFLNAFLGLQPGIYHFNTNIADFSSYKLQNLPNFELPLNKSYQTIFEGYNNNLKRKLKKKNEDVTIELSQSYSQILDFIVKCAQPKMNNNLKMKFNKLYDTLIQRNYIEVYVYYFKNELLAIGVFLLDKDSIINLLPISSEKGKSQNAMAFLLDAVIQKYAEKDVILDFEGSSIEGIAQFYKSFGATNQPYFQYKTNSIFF